MSANLFLGVLSYTVRHMRGMLLWSNLIPPFTHSSYTHSLIYPSTHSLIYVFARILSARCFSLSINRKERRWCNCLYPHFLMYESLLTGGTDHRRKFSALRCKRHCEVLWKKIWKNMKGHKLIMHECSTRSHSEPCAELVSVLFRNLMLQDF